MFPACFAASSQWAGAGSYEYRSLVGKVRIARSPGHQIVARLGKLDGSGVGAAREWSDLDGFDFGYERESNHP